MIGLFLQQEVMDGLERWIPSSGTPQGAVLSPLLANIYLHPLDKLMTEQELKMVRYADDFVILCQSQSRESVRASHGMGRPQWSMLTS